MAGPLPFQFGKLVLISGLVLVGVGLLLMAGSQAGFFGLGKLPGDIAYKGKHVSFYFPVMTCLVLSALGTMAFWSISFLRRP
jgi:hypothetical protein